MVVCAFEPSTWETKADTFQIKNSPVHTVNSRLAKVYIVTSCLQNKNKNKKTHKSVDQMGRA